jgi:hypothetical protein
VGAASLSLRTQRKRKKANLTQKSSGYAVMIGTEADTASVAISVKEDREFDVPNTNAHRWVWYFVFCANFC